MQHSRFDIARFYREFYARAMREGVVGVVSMLFKLQKLLI